ncbi:hypothetical protein ABZU86_31455, partial [Streptomyces sp. NPDC005271]|uniref:hypothetical protein n=1 Tax=unclassified Streptomyces TaxID=2593676 RepID=UPI0033BA66F9
GTLGSPIIPVQRASASSCPSHEPAVARWIQAEPVFTKEEFDKKRDSAFDRALNILRNYGRTTS